MKNNYTVPTKETLFPVRYKKTQVNYSISEDIKHDFDELAKKESYNKSGVIELLMLNFLISKGVRKE